MLKSSSSSVAIHDNWESSSVALLCALIDKSPEQLIIIVRNKKEQRLYPQHANFIIWPLGERPPNLDNYRHFWWELFFHFSILRLLFGLKVNFLKFSVAKEASSINKMLENGPKIGKLASKIRLSMDFRL